MGILNRILVVANDTIGLVSTGDTIQIVPGAKESMFQTCATATTENDVILVCVLSGVVVLCLGVVGLFTYLCMKAGHDSKLKELESRQKHELEKLNHEAALQRERMLHDDEWRNKEYESKEKEREVAQTMKRLEIEMRGIELKSKEQEQKK